MKKYFVKIAFVAIFAAIAGYGVYTSQKSETLSDLALANVEALASGEISEEFYEKTGCIAVDYVSKCTGKDGNTYTYAKKPE